jgi:hypothetical protein
MKPLPLPHPAEVPPERVAALLAPPSDALAGGFGEDVLSAAADGDSEPTGQRTGDGAEGVRSREIELMESVARPSQTSSSWPFS